MDFLKVRYIAKHEKKSVLERISCELTFSRDRKAQSQIFQVSEFNGRIVGLNVSCEKKKCH